MPDTGGRERRKRARVAVDGDVLGRISSVSAAPVLNISETGALLEVASVLRPGSIYMLRLPLAPGRQLNLKSRVVRSYVHGFQQKEGGESVVQYRAAVEFLDHTEEDLRELREHIGQLKGYLDVEF
ncbi:MAG TPA: PilZ domain-containing protein [Vicinamibacteria bacterium]|nr:PilZ domain-containing protein [Vicinamibacteria bacterium]